MTTVAQLIDMITSLLSDDEEKVLPKNALLELINQKYKENVVMLNLLHKKDTISGDGTSRYSLDSNLTYKPGQIKRVFIDTTECARYRALEADVIEGTPSTAATIAASSNDYVWLKVSLSDVLTEQTFTTGSGQLTLAALDSGQTALPTFSGDVQVIIGPAYQDRAAYVSTQASISSGNVTFGLKLSDVGPAGTAYFDIMIRQM